MNAYVYGYGPEGKERLIVIDLGVTFPDMDGAPGVDLIMADTTWLEANAHRIERFSSPTRMRITSGRWPICGPACASRSMHASSPAVWAS